MSEDTTEVANPQDQSHERTPLLVESRKDSISARGSVKSSSDPTIHVGEDVECNAPKANGEDEAEAESQGGSIAGLISILLLGVFVSNADGSIVLATYGIITSEFNELSESGWLVTSFVLGMCATMPLYGKLSDIYGRKALLLVAYFFFAVGCAICGLGTSLWQVILGRVVAGIGGGGMSSLVSILITDLVPLHQVAAWRSYVNVAATLGRSLGGPIGGYLADTIGWRWSFFGQCPATLLAMALVAHKLRSTAPTPQASSSPELQRSNLSRIDFAGAATLALTIVGFLSAIDLGGQKYAWTDPIILGIFGASLVCGTIFVLVEAYWAKEPILPLGLVTKREVAASYAVVGLQIMAQMGMMYTVPLYFQITSHASASVAGAHLFPAVAGNAIGGIIAGIVIKRTRTYHPLTLLSGPISLTAYILLITRWHGHTSTLESLYIIPGGFGTALSQASGFIALTASIDTAHIAVATSGMYLAQNVGVALGMSGASAVLQASLRVVLEGKLEDVEGKAEIIDRALSDVQYVQALKGRVAELVISAYVQCLMYTHLLSVICAVLTFIAALFLKGRRL